MDFGDAHDEGEQYAARSLNEHQLTWSRLVAATEVMATLFTYVVQG